MFSAFILASLSSLCVWFSFVSGVSLSAVSYWLITCCVCIACVLDMCLSLVSLLHAFTFRFMLMLMFMFMLMLMFMFMFMLSLSQVKLRSSEFVVPAAGS